MKDIFRNKCISFHRKIYLGLFIAILGFLTTLKNSLAENSVNTKSYGQIQVYAYLQSTACSMNILSSKEIMLVNCGAGSAFNELNTSYMNVYMPVKLQFYDTENAFFYPSYVTYLGNGNNKILLPPQVNYHNTLRFEVSYE